MGIQLRKLCRERVVVVFGGTTRVGRASIELLSASKRSVAVVAAVENAKGQRARRLKRVSNCFLVQFDPSRPESLRRAVRHADAVLLVPSLTPGGTRFAKHLIDAVDAEHVPAGLALISNVLAARDLPRPGPGRPVDSESTGFEDIEAHARSVLGDSRRDSGSRGTVRFVSLRVPLVMETILHCRDEIVFANRFVACFAPTTVVPCISVRDVAIAAACALVRLMDQHDKPSRTSTSLPVLEPVYTLTDAASASISPVELSRRLSTLLGRPIKYCHLSDEAFVARMKEKSGPEQLALSIVAMKDALEPAGHNSGAENDEMEAKAGAAGDAEELPSDSGAGLPSLTGIGDGSGVLRSTHDFRHLTQSELMAPSMWLEANRSLFERTPQNQMQLFVVGSGDSISVEIGHFVTNQITDPTTRPPPDAGEAALPSTDAVGGSRQYQAPQQAKVTLCTIKSRPPSSPAAGHQTTQASPGRASGQEVQPSHYYHLEGSATSPVAHLLDQLTALDVVLFIPPLRLGVNTCMEVVKTVTAAAARANAWGIVVVSSIFAGARTGTGHKELQELDAIEQAIKSSGVPYVVVRLPLFMEYLLALSSEPTASESSSSPQEPAAEKPPSEEERSVDSESSEEPGRPDLERQEEEAPLLHPSPEMASMYCGGQRYSGARDRAARSEDWPPAAEASQQERQGEAKPPSQERWPLLSRNLASSQLYWMSVLDAAKALVAISFSFPLHRNRTRTLFTESRTLEEVAELARSTVEQRKRSRSRSVATVDLNRVDALRETPGREFWKLAFWPRRLTKCFLECAVDMSVVDNSGGLKASEPFELVTECPPISMDRWMQLHAKSLSRALAPRQPHARPAAKSMEPAAAATMTA